jgi:hypothetical protein
MGQPYNTENSALKPELIGEVLGGEHPSERGRRLPEKSSDAETE